VAGQIEPTAMDAAHQPPSAATEAVLVKSVEMPEGAQKVEELDFNKFKGRPITVDDLFQGMKHMGFQASSMCEAVRIINEMVRERCRPPAPGCS
jgi:deoxyhypusine synthase